MAFGDAREDLHAFGHGRRAGRQRLGRLLDLDQAHAAVGRDRQLVVIAEARDVDAFAIRGADDDLALASLHRHAVDFNVDEFNHGSRLGFRHIVAHAACRCPSTMLRPP
jgi:hypothetical protein